MLGQSRRPDALKYRRNELLADLAASGRDHGWRIVKTPVGAFRLVTVQFIAYRRILAVLTRDAPDSGFRYPAGYRIGRIVKNYPAG